MASDVMTESGESPFNERPSSSGAGYQNPMTRNVSSVCEIEEENSSDLFEINSFAPMASIKEAEGSLLSCDMHDGDDIVYVVVGNKNTEDSSMDALVWTLNHAVNPSSTLVYLIHVYPESRLIPTPLGKLPMSQANPEQKQNYIVQETRKRIEFLQKFLDMCSASKVKVDTIPIESDMEGKAILDLISIFNIKKLVFGITKSSLRKMRSRRGSGIADQILQNAPEFCEVKIICEGKEVFEEQMIESPSPCANDDSPKPMQEQLQINDSFTCNCFKPKVVT